MKVGLFHVSGFGNLPNIPTKKLSVEGPAAKDPKTRLRLDIVNLVACGLKMLREGIEATVNNTATGCE